MKNYSHYKQADYSNTIYRPKGKIMGVCAGIAQQFGWDVVLVRIIALLCLFTFTGATFLIYIIAGALFY